MCAPIKLIDTVPARLHETLVEGDKKDVDIAGGPLRPSISAPGRADSYHADEKGPYVTEDGDEPSDDEKHVLRHIGEKLPVSAFLVAFVELCERFTYYGTPLSVPCSVKPPLMFDRNLWTVPELHPEAV